MPSDQGLSHANDGPINLIPLQILLAKQFPVPNKSW